MNKRTGDIAILVPVYNEHEKIGGVIRLISEIMGGRLGLLVVADDGSTDGSGDIAKASGAGHVVRLRTNSGNGAATRAALDYIASTDRGFSAVIRLDGDGQHDAHLLPVVMDRFDSGTDVIVCSRFHPRSNTAHAMLDRRCLNSAMAMMLQMVTRWPVTDARSGFFCIRWSLLSGVVHQLQTQRYGIPIELLLRVWHGNPQATYAEIPHPAMYQPGISRRLDVKYTQEDTPAKVARMADAYRVFLETCSDLGIVTGYGCHDAMAS